MAYRIVTENGSYCFVPARDCGKSLWNAKNIMNLLSGDEPVFNFVEVSANKDNETEICLQDT